MTKKLTIQLPDVIYEHVSGMAQKAGQTPEEWTVARLHAITPKSVFLTPEERARSLAELMKYAGAASSGDPNAADNEKIDRDLAREYESTHD
jgi:hypothetical protein